MALKIFIDGHVGTTGLRIHEMLSTREDLELIAPPDTERKNPNVRRKFLGAADLAILCLPDDAAKEAVAAVSDGTTKIIDASTAHRINPSFAYGLPELSKAHREAITESRFVANPGCYPTSVILALAPLVEEGILAADAAITLHALSGYSGGGRTMIERWENPEGGLVGLPFEAPYALDQRHKHLAEMMRFTGLTNPPQFTPAVGSFASGMRVEIPIHRSTLLAQATATQIHELLESRYAEEGFVHVAPLRDPFTTEETTLDPRKLNGTNSVELQVAAHPDGHVMLFGLLDNLGKGASGAAVQNLNLMLGLPEDTGLRA